MQEIITIKNILHARENGISRISAEVAGEVLWFESGDIELQSSAEGFVSALLVSALRKKTNIVIDGVVDKTWLSNVHGAMKQFGKWWGHRRISISAMQGKASRGEKGQKTALCFSGGVDSFHILLCCAQPIDYLVFIHGYDIPLGDTVRLNAYLPCLKAIAEKTGARLIIIRTNIREHNFFRAVSWLRSYGCALAAISHFMTDVGKFIIAASYPYNYSTASGSHWKTDPLFSSSYVDIIHGGAWAGRNEKIRSIADEPLARKYLRVCWEHRNESINCCQCEKCIRTMLSLEQCKKLCFFETFPLKDNLLQYLQELPRLEEHLIPIYNRLFVWQRGLDPVLEKAIYALLRRSHKGPEVLRYYMDRIIEYYKRRGNAFEKKEVILQ
jgi:hypothetical protein